MKNNIEKFLQILLQVKAGIWLVFSIWYFFRFYFQSPNNKAGVVIVSVLMLGNAIVFGGFSFLINRKLKAVYYFLIFYVALNVLLTFTDQLGVYDVIVFVLDLLILAILTKWKNLFIKNEQSGKKKR